MHFAAAVILDSSLTGFVLGPRLSLLLSPHRLQLLHTDLTTKTISQFALSVKKTVDLMNNLQTTTRPSKYRRQAGLTAFRGDVGSAAGQRLTCADLGLYCMPELEDCIQQCYLNLVNSEDLRKNKRLKFKKDEVYRRIEMFQECMAKKQWCKR
ncbi:hypothetical protein C8J57DRAFT_1228686 [Mycena rebaudengoi]|nr:hypothetical protein C8J57DRAFT_1228686 [Mycena rebaudengoi]